MASLACLAIVEVDLPGTTTPPADRVYASLVRGKLEYPDPSNLALSPAAQSEMWQRSAQLVGLPEN